MDNKTMDLLVVEIKNIMEEARTRVARQINNAMLHTYWHIGRIIIEHEQDGNLKAQYGEFLRTKTASYRRRGSHTYIPL